MFSVGEFSRLAQVSKRLLRYYDEIGLLKPAHIDSATGYRYYSAEQMPQLNRILALKELGLSLDQIRRLLNDQVSSDEIQGMLLLKKAEIEQQMQAELQRIRKIESRLESIRNAESGEVLNVIIKNIPAQPVIRMRRIVDSFEVGLEIFTQMHHSLPAGSLGLRYCICHSDGLSEYDIDLEMGFFIEAKEAFTLAHTDGFPLEYDELPAAETMATFVVKGALESIHTGYTQIGTWVETNRFRFAGTPREVTLQVPQSADGRDLITEIQFPVEPIP
jgi:DNA-binding transcriptional MerR regulator